MKPEQLGSIYTSTDPMTQAERLETWINKRVRMQSGIDAGHWLANLVGPRMPAHVRDATRDPVSQAEWARTYRRNGNGLKSVEGAGTG